MITRHVERTLQEWKSNPKRRPLLLRGARQVGKSFTVRSFGQDQFEQIIEINFELYPQFCDCFHSLDPVSINQQISILTKQDIVPGKTLLFFDEVQKCPQAIKSLRYYYEKMPQLHVIAAGSLLEFVIDSEKLEMPVGRLEYLYMYPLSFFEFLQARQEDRLLIEIQKGEHGNISAAVHDHALHLLKTYYVVGGMPAVVDLFIETSNLLKCQQLQAAICQTFRDDFGKYASQVKHQYLQKIFDSVPKMVGKKFIYSKVDQDVQSREIKEATHLLEKAGILHKVKATNATGLPLEAGVREKHFKFIFLDMGLMQNIQGLSGDILASRNLLDIYQGSLAEQFVGQELIASAPSYQKANLYYWTREAKSSSAEIDYLVNRGSEMIPIEVKSGSRGTLKSLHLFMKQYHSQRGVVFSQKMYDTQEAIAFHPLYSVGIL